MTTRPQRHALLPALFLALLLSGVAPADSVSDGMKAFSQGDYPAAVRAFAAAVKEKPKDASVRAWLGSRSTGWVSTTARRRC